MSSEIITFTPGFETQLWIFLLRPQSNFGAVSELIVARLLESWRQQKLPPLPVYVRAVSHSTSSLYPHLSISLIAIAQTVD